MAFISWGLIIIILININKIGIKVYSIIISQPKLLWRNPAKKDPVATNIKIIKSVTPWTLALSSGRAHFAIMSLPPI